MARVITLAIEASTYSGSTALTEGTQLLGERSVAMRGRDHEALMPAVADLLADCGLPASSIARVVCGAGPGAFTSLRIAGSIAKGLALAVGARLVPVSSLALVVASRVPREAGRFLATADAMRGEHYVQEYAVSAQGEVSVAGALAIVSSSHVDQIASERGLVVLGPGRTGAQASTPRAGAVVFITNLIDDTANADLSRWEPGYGRLAEAQVKWEAAHGRPLLPH